MQNSTSDWLSGRLLWDWISETIVDFREHPYIGALVIIGVSLVVAWLTDLVITRFVLRLTRKTRSDIDDRIVKLLHRPVFTTVLLIGVGEAIEMVMDQGLVATIDHLKVTLIVVVWTLFLLRLLTLVLSWMLDNPKVTVVQPATAPLFTIGSKLVVLGAAAYTLMVVWQQDLTAWLASAGILGLAIGLAAQETLGNLFAGVSILADAPYKVGDFIVLDGTERGKVTRIGLRSTRLLTRDEIEVTIPNAIIAKSKIVNESGGPSPMRRLRVPVGVAYGTDVKKAEQILLESIQGIEGVSKYPAPMIRFIRFGASSIDFELRCWINEPVLRGRVLSAINTRVYEALNQYQIEIPFPKQDVYVRELPGKRAGEDSGPSDG